MGETVLVRQNADLATAILAARAEGAGGEGLEPVGDIRQLTPYGMLLAGLGCCTALVLHTYAHNHGVHLHEVELRVTYERTFASDCQDCEGDTPNEESIRQEVVLIGPLSETDRRKLLRVAGYCPIHKMLANGIRVITRLAEGGKQASADGVPDEYHPR